MVFQSFNLLENMYFHIIIAPVILIGIFFSLKLLFKMKWKSIELKVTLLIILTTLIITELIILILLVFEGNILYYLISLTFGFILFIYLLHFTIKSIIAYSNNLILAKEEIERSQNQYKTAYKNAELYKDVFAHDISNMLQNLTFSIDYYNFLSDDKNNKELIKEIMNNYNNQVKHGTELVRNVRVLSKLEVQDFSLYPTNLTPMIKKIINEIAQIYPDEHIKITLEDNNHKSLVLADNNFYHLINNLILNGIIHNDNLQKEVSIKIGKAEKIYENYYKIDIIDNGRGLDPQLKEIYSKFFINDEIKFRPGLGLLVAKRLISIYNGYIFIGNRIEHDYTKGTKVIVYLPKLIE